MAIQEKAYEVAHKFWEKWLEGCVKYGGNEKLAESIRKIEPMPDQDCIDWLDSKAGCPVSVSDNESDCVLPDAEDAWFAYNYYDGRNAINDGCPSKEYDVDTKECWMEWLERETK